MKIHEAFGDDCSSAREQKTDTHRISVIFFQLFFHVKLDNRLHFSVSFNTLFPTSPSLTAPYELKLILLFLVSDKMECKSCSLYPDVLGVVVWCSVV